MNAIAQVDQSAALMPPKRGEAIAVLDPIPLLDTGRFEHMQRIATIMARSPLVPDSLRCVTTKSDDNNRKKELLPFEEALSNCFLVVNQAVRWNMDPFAVAQCVSVVHGRLCYEGKLVAAVLEQKLGVSLIYEWNSSSGDAFGIKVSGTLPNGRTETIMGTVGQWKTTGNNSPWIKHARLMLAYRGSREWARLFAPGVMLGVYTDDELQDMQDGARAARARNVTPVPQAERPAAVTAPPAAERLAPPPATQRPASPPAASRQSAPQPRPEPAADAGVEQEPDLEGLVRQFEDDASTAQSLDDLEDCAEQVQPYINGDLSHLMPRALRERAIDAWEDNRKRIVNAAGPEDRDDETPREQVLARCREAAMNGPRKLKFFLGKLPIEEYELLTEADIKSLEAAAAQVGG